MFFYVLSLNALFIYRFDRMAKSFIKVFKDHIPDVTEYREAAHAMFFARTDKKVKVPLFKFYMLMLLEFQISSYGTSIQSRLW